jgi:hypothetical protein
MAFIVFLLYIYLYLFRPSLHDIFSRRMKQYTRVREYHRYISIKYVVFVLPILGMAGFMYRHSAGSLEVFKEGSGVLNR